MKAEILSILRKSNSYVSGQTLCNRLGVSRTAVWKAVQQLKDEGYEIEAVTNKGYRLVQIPDVLTAVELQSQMLSVSDNAVAPDGGNSAIGSHIEALESVDSTNNYAKKIAENGAQHGTLVIAEQQTGGKGRRGRSWVSPKGSGIWMSYILRPQMYPDRASMLTLAAAMATAAGIRKALEAHNLSALCQIKWPNDIVLNGRKIVGILTEMSAEPDCVNYVVVGIGINVNITNFPEELQKTATSLLLETGVSFLRSSIVVDISGYFKQYYHIFMKTHDFSALAEEYNAMLVNCGREVMIDEKNGQLTGTAEGIDAFGRLLVRTASGETKQIIAGEVSVRGMYGYV